MKQTEETEAKKKLTDEELQQATGGIGSTIRLDCKTIEDSLTCLDNYSKGCTWKAKEGYCYNYKYDVKGASEILNDRH